jgi:ligand-binding sensor domain-containing protein
MGKSARTGLIFINCLLAVVNCFSQEIPLGTWRSHNSYNAIRAITFSANNVYAAASNGLVVVNLADNSLSMVTRLDGLSSTDITAVAFDQPRNQLLVTYADGMIDLIRTHEIISYNALKNSTTIAGSKQINAITIHQHLAYLSADYGLVVFDLNQREIKETWRDLGPTGQTLRIVESTFLGDSIFLATEQGVIAGNLNDNLLDFARWKRFSSPVNSSVQSIAAFNGKVYAALNGDGLFEYESGNWIITGFSESTFTRITASNHLLITEGINTWKLTPSGTLIPVETDKVEQPFLAREDASGKLWIGDLRNGLVSDKTGSFQSYIPNGPTFSGSFRLSVHNQQLFAVSGGFTPTLTPSGKNELINVFSNGMWSTQPTFITQDVTGIKFTETKTFIASFGGGLQVVENNSATLHTSENSPLTNNRISAIALSKEGLWIASYESPQPLHLLKQDNTWESFSFPQSASQFPTHVQVDNLGQVWMVLNPAQGGGILVFNREKNQHAYLTDASGSGALPSRSVFSIAADRDGQVWIGTSQGVAYFPNPAQALSGNVNSIKPIFNGRFLLRDETVTALVSDGGNRKWIGTLRGLWLFDSFGEKEIYNFNSANSPLLSDRIVDMAIQPVTGEVFIGTDKGIVSYRADATGSSPVFEKVKIFPNPVTAEFNGVVSISGLSTDATVKITDISGKLIWQTNAHGGTATWNTRDYTGRRAATGMYLVIAVSQDGSDSIVGKIAIIN